MIRVLPALASIKQRYERIESALADAEEKGYGIVMPSPEELSLDEPRVVKHSGGYCVRMNASADSMHFIKTGIKTELSPVIGTEEQCKGIRDQLSRELEEKNGGIWGYEVFGRTLFDLAKDGLMEKVGHMSDDSREKMGETLERIINEGANGLICILL
jgi:stage IV sporulation protein A